MNNEYLIVELLVQNHPGVMSHITGLFSRRAFNLEGILCGRVGDGSRSRMYLLVRNDDFLEQIIKQLSKLHDVVQVNVHEDYNYEVFNSLDSLLNKEQ
jgi:acetolactate synthase I/III small subunit